MAQVGNWRAVPRDQDVLFSSVSKSINLKAYKPTDLPSPNTDLARSVEEFARKHLDIKQLNHSIRCYHFGLAILQATYPDWEVDRETWWCTCLLHDIGLAEAFHLTTKMSFEFKGGIVARDFLLQHGANEDQADSVCESIILHQDIWVKGGNISLNGQMIILATLFDNAGKFAEYVHQDTIRSVCEAFPRQGWSEAFACAVEKEMREKPWSHTTTFEKPDWRQEGNGSQFGDTARGNEVMKPYD